MGADLTCLKQEQISRRCFLLHIFKILKMVRQHMKKDAAVFSFCSIFGLFLFLVLFCLDAVFSSTAVLIFMFSPQAIAFWPKPVFIFFLTQNALERTVQPQFAYSGPQGTAKPFMCEYLTNQQITGWNAERVLQFSGERFLAPHLQIHRHLLTFKDISAPLIFDQALHNTACICMWACSLSLV